MQRVAGLVLDVREVLSAVSVGNVVWAAKVIACARGCVHHLSDIDGASGALGQLGLVRLVGLVGLVITLNVPDELDEAVSKLPRFSQNAQPEASATIIGSCRQIVRIARRVGMMTGASILVDTGW